MRTISSRSRILLTAALAALVLLVGALGLSHPSHAQSGGGYDLSWNTQDSGGGTSAGAGYGLVAVSGQSDAGQRSGFGYRLSGGFLFGEVTPPLAGDCNFDGAVDAADMTAMVLEVFDGDPAGAGFTAGGTFPGSSGCDANVDANVDAGDLACAVRLIFLGQGSCGP